MGTVLTTTPGRITKVERLLNSPSGNPTYRITFTRRDGEVQTYRTLRDAAFAYDLENSALIGDNPPLLRLRLTAEGHVFDAEPVVETQGS